MDPARLAELKGAIEEIGRHRFAPPLTVAQAKHHARDTLIAFGQKPHSVSVREATLVLSQRLDQIDADDPGLGWEPLLYALQVFEHTILGEAGS